jgi:hypothetical protein
LSLWLIIPDSQSTTGVKSTNFSESSFNVRNMKNPNDGGMSMPHIPFFDPSTYVGVVQKC